MKFSLRAVIIFSMILLSFFGLLTILSSQSEGPHPYHLASRQMISFAFAAVLMMLCGAIPFHFFRRQGFLLSGLFLLSILILPLLGSRINGMCGWFRFGDFSIQPTETAKAFFLLGEVMLLETLKDSKKRFPAAILYLFIWVGAILIQPDFGTAFIYAACSFMLFFIAGIKWRWLLSCAIPAAAAVMIFIKLHPYAMKRISAFLNPQSSWHLQQLELAVARGGWFGSKLGQALWSNAYVPLPYNDSAYATLTETIGFAGALLVLILFTVLIGALSIMALRAKNRSAGLYIAGCAVLISFQTLLHLGVNLSLLPPTGLTLPLISYGGSSLVGCGILLGIALSASKSEEAAADN